MPILGPLLTALSVSRVQDRHFEKLSWAHLGIDLRFKNILSMSVVHKNFIGDPKVMTSRSTKGAPGYETTEGRLLSYSCCSLQRVYCN